jgi:hypothetical protein
VNESRLRTAGLGRRILALLVDWAIASAISAGFFNFHELATLGVFAAMTWVLVSLTGATVRAVDAGGGSRR